MRYEVNIEELKKEINEWVKVNIGSNFEFREHQFETILDICTNILENVNHTQLIEAPTGSGKSLLNIISAGVLADYYDKASYILCSDLYLWKQYEDFVKQHPKINKKFGMLKGQTGNYTCAKNGQDMRNADCRMAGIGWGNMFNPSSAKQLGYECALSCPYVKARKKAMKAKVCIITYQLYHFFINVILKEKSITGGNPIFLPRDILFCDECHNIPDIIKMCFTPEVKLSDLKQLKAIYSYNGGVELDLFNENPDLNDKVLISSIMSITELEDTYTNIFNVLDDPYVDKKNLEKGVHDYFDLLHNFMDTIEAIESQLAFKKKVLHQKYTPDDIKMYKGCSWFRNMMCLWNDFITSIENTGIEYVVRQIEYSRNLKEDIVTFSNAREDFMCWYFLLHNAHNRVMMSATIGGYDAYYDNIGFKYLENEFEDPEEEIQYTVIPSTFNFDESPVNFLNRYKMSYANKEQSLLSLKPIIYKICSSQFNGKRGMIQTGSYANAKEIYDSAPDEVKNRMLLYNNSKEKTKMITIHQMSKDTILIGPTLVEGIDLPGDQCSFIIILKVPYPVIVDDYVKLKMELFPKWYNSATSNIIIQGIGRGNRFKEDKCITYILDACFMALYNATKDQYSKELQERIKMYA